MDEKLYKKLREIEDSLFWIAKNNNMIYSDELGDIWAMLWKYLKRITLMMIIHNVSLF